RRAGLSSCRCRRPICRRRNRRTLACLVVPGVLPATVRAVCRWSVGERRRRGALLEGMYGLANRGAKDGGARAGSAPHGLRAARTSESANLSADTPSYSGERRKRLGSFLSEDATMPEVLHDAAVIHVRFEGRSRDVALADLGLGPQPGDGAIKRG